jgi:hypothetical protein
MTLLLPSVTAPFRAKARPNSVTLSFSVMLVRVMMLPCHADPTPSVAELEIHVLGLRIIDQDDASGCCERAARLEDKDRIRISAAIA